MTIRTAQPHELPTLQTIEVAAGVLFRDIGMTDVAGHPPPSLEVFEHSRQAGRLWVTADADDRPTGFVFVVLVDGAAHIEQISVHPDHQGQGLGSALIEQVMSWAAGQGLPAVTLSTFRSVPWNAPYYARRGFVELGELTPGLIELQAAEAALGLDPAERVFMRRVVARE
ncbi:MULTISPECIES: GNAT family N-acetyltransferase [unclassified Kribbella]|uniref:GNAT family N-acetyltransferase n=1 Tax=unclassified Kribbella TaxID=2644121 RepID=UPI0033C1351D